MGASLTKTASDRVLTDDQKMIKRLLGYVSMSDKYEEARRKTDRVGGNLKYSKHWQIPVSNSRAALTVNVAGAIIDHKDFRFMRGSS